jgi:hypothetical protein
MRPVHQGGLARRPDENRRDAGELLRSDESTDLMSRIAALGGDPVIVAHYVLLLRAIRDGCFPSELVTRSNGGAPRLTDA